MAFPAFVGAAGKAVTTAIGINQANKNRAFQRKNLKNAVQWRVDDLRKAGINPILAANMGLGTGGSPAGAMPQIPDFGQVGDQLTKAKDVSSQVGLRKSQGKLLNIQLAKETANVGLIRAQTEKTLADKMVALNQSDIRKPAADIGHWLSEWFTKHGRSKAGGPRPASAYELWRLLDEKGILQGNWEQSRQDIELLWEHWKKGSPGWQAYEKFKE